VPGIGFLGAALFQYGDAEYQQSTLEELLGPLNEVERKNAPPVLYVGGQPDVSVESRSADLNKAKLTAIIIVGSQHCN